MSHPLTHDVTCVARTRLSKLRIRIWYSNTTHVIKDIPCSPNCDDRYLLYHLLLLTTEKKIFKDMTHSLSPRCPLLENGKPRVVGSNKPRVLLFYQYDWNFPTWTLLASLANILLGPWATPAIKLRVRGACFWGAVNTLEIYFHFF